LAKYITSNRTIRSVFSIWKKLGLFVKVANATI